MPPKKCKKPKNEPTYQQVDLQLCDDVIDMLELDLDALSRVNEFNSKLMLQNELKQKIEKLLLKIDELTTQVENAGLLQDTNDSAQDLTDIIETINNINLAISTEELVENAVKLYETNMRQINKLKNTKNDGGLIVKKIAQ